MSNDKVLVRGVIVIVADPQPFTVELHVLLSQSFDSACMHFACRLRPYISLAKGLVSLGHIPRHLQECRRIQ